MTETTRHRKAFAAYWEMGSTRSIERLHQELRRGGSAPSLRTLYAWSSTYHWQDRLVRLERDARHAEDEARVAAVREMSERHAREALLLQQKGAEWLTTLDVEQVSAEAAIRAVAEGIRLERLVRGEVTQRTAIEDDSRLEGISDEQLEALINLSHSLLEGKAAEAS